MIATTGRLTRSAQAVRALVATLVATSIAAASHVIGGGAAPGLAGLIVPLTLSFVVCWHLATRMNSWWRTTVGVTASQALFHGLFVVGSGSAVTATSGHAHHLAPGDVAVAAASHSAHGAHGGLAMTVSHLAAAFLTSALLVRLDWALARALTALRALLSPLAHLSHTNPTMVPRSRLVPAVTAASAPRPSAVTHGPGLRGPPVISAVSA